MTFPFLFLFFLFSFFYSPPSLDFCKNIGQIMSILSGQKTPHCTLCNPKCIPTYAYPTHCHHWEKKIQKPKCEITGQQLMINTFDCKFCTRLSKHVESHCALPIGQWVSWHAHLFTVTCNHQSTKKKKAYFLFSISLSPVIKTLFLILTVQYLPFTDNILSIVLSHCNHFYIPNS